MAELVTALRKPSLREMFDEPIVRTLMARDGVRERDVVTALAKARAGLVGKGLVPWGSRVRGVPEPQQRRL